VVLYNTLSDFLLVSSMELCCDHVLAWSQRCVLIMYMCIQLIKVLPGACSVLHQNLDIQFLIYYSLLQIFITLNFYTNFDHSSYLKIKVIKIKYILKLHYIINHIIVKIYNNYIFYFK
jgi:hypothetical protein